LRHLASHDPDYPPILFFHQGSLADGRTFFDQMWPEARAVSDSSKKFYSAFGLKQGGLQEMLGPRVFARGLRSTIKGNFIGRPIGDPWLMPGVFLIHEERIVWQHRYRHAGDHPDFSRIPTYLPAAERL